MKYELKKQSGGDIVSTTLNLAFADNFGKFAAIMFLSQIPGLLANLGTLAYLKDITANGFPSREDVLWFQLFAMLALFVTFIFYSIGQGAMIKAVAAAYQEEQFSVGHCFSSVLGKLWSIIGANILIGLAAAGIAILTMGLGGVIAGAAQMQFLTFIAAVLCFWFLVKFILSVAVFVPAIMVEDLGAMGSLKRSRQLTQGFLLQIFWAFFLICVPLFLLNIGVQYAMGGQQTMGYAFVSWVVGVLGQIVLSVATVVIYFSIRSHKEAFVLQDVVKAFD